MARELDPAEVRAMEQLQEVDGTYGDGRAYDRDRVTAEARHYLGQGVLAMLEAGKRLIVLKEHEAHGEWLPLLKRIGISRDVAKSMMRAARKFLGGPNTSLVTDLPSITHVYELALMDDDDLDELREGGTVAGQTLDDIQRMSPSELRTALRKERQERKERSDAQAKIVGRRDQEIERLQRNLDQSQEALDNAQSGRVKPDERANMLAVAVARLDTDAEVWMRNAEGLFGELLTLNVDDRESMLHVWGMFADAAAKLSDRLRNLETRLEAPPAEGYVPPTDDDGGTLESRLGLVS
ncbi:MAG: hypothetical protein OXC31_26675 [Spirochaetaceae bacterium]|nr:hypothetical protein [Spirochaetaceae bacterium]